MKKCFQSGAGRREEAQSGTFTAAALQCWLCLIRAAVKLGLEITRGNTPTVFTAGSQQRNSQLSIIAPSEECSIKRRFFYLIETGHFSDSDMTSVSQCPSSPSPGQDVSRLHNSYFRVEFAGPAVVTELMTTVKV